MQKYKDVFELLKNDPKADAEFKNLPSYVQNSIKERAKGVNSLESMRNYADKLTRGDN